MPVRGQDLVAKNIIAYGGGFTRVVNQAMTEVHFLLDKKITDNISLTDHNLKDLSKLDHPYAARHGSHGKEIHNPYYQVHRQSGKLVNSKFGGTKRAEINLGRLSASAFVGLDEGKAKHAAFIVFGTSKMIPRPVLEGSRQEVLPEAMGIIKTKLKDLNFRFRGEETK